MKLTEKKIRQLIRKSLREVFEPSDADREEVISRLSKERQDAIKRDPNILDTRVAGLQSPEEVRKDRDQMRDHQETYQKGIKEIHSAIMSGEITVMHSLGYAAGTEAIGTNVFKAKSKVDSWVEMNGIKGNMSLSTVIFDIPYEDFKSGNVSPSVIESNSQDRQRKGGASSNSIQMQTRSTQGLILKGYPVISGKYDLGTQTMGTVSSALLKHQDQSGFAKRSDKYNPNDLIKNMEELKEFGGTEETVLDNWQVVAPYMNIGMSTMLNKIKKSGIGSIKLSPEELDIFINQKKYLKFEKSKNDIKSKVLKIAKEMDVKKSHMDEFENDEINLAKFLTGSSFLFPFKDELEGTFTKEDYMSGRLANKALEYFKLDIDKYNTAKKQLKPLETFNKFELSELMTYFKLLNVSMKYKLDEPVLI